MNRHIRRCFAAALVAAVLPVTTFAQPASEPLLERLLEPGASPFSLGVSQPLLPDLGPVAPAIPGERFRLLDADERGKATSFDLKLRWPGTDAGPVEPYVSVGPALIITEPDAISALARNAAEPSVRLGGKVGAGINWRLDKDTTLFGAYGFTTGAQDGILGVGPKATGDAANPGFELMYGIRFRY
jgi:hypothetical protein